MPLSRLNTTTATIDPLGRAFRAWRAERGVMLFEIATLLGISSADLSGYEVGRKPWPDDLRLRVQHMLGAKRARERL